MAQLRVPAEVARRLQTTRKTLISPAGQGDGQPAGPYLAVPDHPAYQQVLTAFSGLRRTQFGEQHVDHGTTEVWLSNATLVERRQHEGRMHYAFTTPGRTVRYHRPAESLST